MEVTAKALRNWEGGSNYPSNVHLQKLIELYLGQHAFAPGHEREEAHALWEQLHESTPRRISSFDEQWFASLLTTWQAKRTSQESHPQARQHLLATRLHAPRLRPRLVSRAHLIEQLQQGVEGPLTLLSAPAGFGKTTLLAQWLQESEMPVAWLSLEPEDNDPTRFLASLIAALQALDLQIGTTVLAVLQTPQPPSPEVVLAHLINELMERGGGNMALVLDDYHVITTDAIQREMVCLVEHLPPHLHLLLSARTDPPLSLARLRARGQLTEVRAANLRFGPAETSVFLQDVMGLNLPTEAIATLEQRTEGWAAGLQLAALSLRGRTDVSAFLAAFSGTHRFVLEYLTDEVLARQPAAVQTFLLYTSILDRLRGSLCDAVMGQEGSQAMLEALDKANLFVVALDEEQHWYRYHHLFAEVLRRHLQQREPALVPTLHRQASAWFEQHGLPAEAVQHALAIPDAELVARLIEPIALPVAFQGQISTVLGWLDPLPEALMRTRPLLCTYHAILLTFTNQSEAAEVRLQTAERGMREEMREEQARTIRGWVLADRMALPYFCGGFPQATSLARQALPLLPEAEVIPRAGAMVIVTSAYLVSGDVTLTTEHEVAAAGALARIAGNLLSTVRSICVLARLHVLQGKLKQAAVTYAQVAQEVPLPEVLRTMFICFSYYFSWGDLLREWNALDTAEEHLTQGMVLINEALPLEPWVAVLGYTALARLLQARGKSRAALATLDALAHLAKQRHYPAIWAAQGEAVRAQLELVQGNMAAAIRWADASGLSLQDPDLSYPHESVYLTLARVRIAQGQEEGASPRLQDVLHLLDRLRSQSASGQHAGNPHRTCIGAGGPEGSDSSACHAGTSAGAGRTRGLHPPLCR